MSELNDFIEDAINVMKETNADEIDFTYYKGDYKVEIKISAEEFESDDPEEE